LEVNRRCCGEADPSQFHPKRTLDPGFWKPLAGHLAIAGFRHEK